MASTIDRNRLRRERTFVGSECAVCEEPLEHTLQGERILQFSCTHVSHEACFYEFIRELEAQYCPTCDAPLHLDTSRSGNVLDISSSSNRAKGWGLAANPRPDKISSFVRTAGTGSGSDTRSTHTPTPAWDNQTVRPPSVDSSKRRQQFGNNGRGSMARGSLRDSRDAPLSDRYGSSSRHARSDSEATGVASGGYPETMQSGPQWRHDYDVQAMETTPGSPKGITRKPIPSPSVTVRSEFPTISRSRQQQTLTCLVTVEVADNGWKPDPEDIGAPPHQPPSVIARIDEVASRSVTPAPGVPRFYPYESAEVLEEMTESLRSRVDNWHGLDFSR